MDPSMQQVGAPVTPEAMDQIIGLLEEMGQQIAALQQASQTQATQFEKVIGELSDHMEDLDQRLAQASTPPTR
jgi:methyl-accepting chemotaxis protein